MAKTRKGVSYRRHDRPYTRKSKFKKKNYIRAMPNCKVVRFEMGDLQKKFPFFMDLVTTKSFQLRHNAIEAARLTCIRLLEKKLGKNGFRFTIRVYPHQVLRENPLASGAGADRMSTGMKCAFGKPIGIAARVFEGQTMFSVGVEKVNLGVAKEALGRIKHKVPCQCRVVERK